MVKCCCGGWDLLFFSSQQSHSRGAVWETRQGLLLSSYSSNLKAPWPFGSEIQGWQGQGCQPGSPTASLPAWSLHPSSPWGVGSAAESEQGTELTWPMAALQFCCTISTESQTGLKNSKVMNIPTGREGVRQLSGTSQLSARVSLFLSQPCAGFAGDGQRQLWM